MKEAGKSEGRTKPESIYAIAMRERKALRLADFLGRANITADDCATASEEDWRLAAEAAGVKPTSAETKRVVVEMLRSREPKA